MPYRDFRGFPDTLDDLNPARIESAQMKIGNLRQKTEALSEVVGRINRDRCATRRDYPRILNLVLARPDVDFETSCDA